MKIMCSLDYASSELAERPYLGTWYNDRMLPQSLRLYVNGDTHKIFIDEDSYDGSVSESVWNGITLRFLLPFYCISWSGEKEFLEYIACFCKNLLDEYEKTGEWDDLLIRSVELNLMDYESDLCFESVDDFVFRQIDYWSEDFPLSLENIDRIYKCMLEYAKDERILIHGSLRDKLKNALEEI